MKYNLYGIGLRITELRKKRGMTQQNLIDKLKNDYDFAIGRNKLSEIETGGDGVNVNISLEFLCCIAMIFDCDIGYLLGEYTEQKQEAHQICSATGLSETALYKIQEEKNNLCIEKLNEIIVDKNFWEILYYFYIYKDISDEIFKENEKYSKLFWKMSKDSENKKLSDMCERASIAMEQQKYDYDMRRYKCKFLFEHILDKFLPKTEKDGANNGNDK